MALLEKTQKVLHLDHSDGTHALFNPEPGGDSPTQVLLGDADWLDMGEPDTITVAIEPGDRLNPETDEEPDDE